MSVSTQKNTAQFDCQAGSKLLNMFSLLLFFIYCFLMWLKFILILFCKSVIFLYIKAEYNSKNLLYFIIMINFSSYIEVFLSH